MGRRLEHKAICRRESLDDLPIVRVADLVSRPGPLIRKSPWCEPFEFCHLTDSEAENRRPELSDHQLCSQTFFPSFITELPERQARGKQILWLTTIFHSPPISNQF